ncbi:MAG: nitrous oxide reductase family maturation protein NosD [Bacteroidales bacterium]|nr:nitrous oxide reductase family maturation protein NosD [Bacteroidales bacterium]
MITVLIHKFNVSFLYLNQCLQKYSCWQARLPKCNGGMVCGFFLILILFTNNSYSQEKSFGTYYPYDINLPDSTLIKLQPIIDRADTGETILLEPGIYTGPVYIKKDGIVLDGQGKCIITGLDYQSVVYIEGDSIHIKNFVITNSGGSHDLIDCGVQITGSNNTVENCRIQECLFGIDIFKSDNNLIVHNEISSLTRRQKALKGDAIRLWWAKRNILRGNYWHSSRDMVIWYSSENLIEENKGIGNRYSIHFMYAHNNRIRANEFYNNSVGVFLMYSERTIMTDNLIMGSVGISGMCLGLKETSSNQILNNRFIYSAEGIHYDVSPYVPEQINTIQNNEIAFCGSGMFFHTNQEGNVIKQNYFHNNLSQVTIEGKTANRNVWENNYFDDYQGFDRDDDNVGDTPYELFTYVEHLWDFNKNLKFFYGAPLLVILDFLERLAPFSEPKFVLRDKEPMYFWEDKNKSQ